MKFWDSSAVVPLLIEQGPSRSMLQAFAHDPQLSVWWGTVVECDSAIARAERDGRVSATASDVARARLKELSAAWRECQPSERLRRAALRMVRLHGLRAGAAFQAAAASVIAEQDSSTLHVVCLDSRLAEALRSEGFVIDVAASAE